MGAEGPTTTIPITEIQKHAGTVDNVADAVELARSAVKEVSMQTSAYGQLCQFLPALLTPVFGLGVDAMRESVAALQETAIHLRSTASSTTSTDTAAADKLDRIPASHPRGRIELPL